MKKNASARALKWPLILLIQFLAMLALGALTALSLFLGGSIHKLCVWGLFPLCGMSSACIATRLGLLNYAAWLVPPAAEFVSHALIWGYSPEVGPVFLCAFLSLVGAAAGEVLKRQMQK